MFDIHLLVSLCCEVCGKSNISSRRIIPPNAPGRSEHRPQRPSTRMDLSATPRNGEQ